MNKLKFGIIGCGRISYKHIEALIENKDTAELVAVCDLFEYKAVERKLQYLNHMPSAKVLVYTDYKELLKSSGCDVVAIATESGYHAEHAIYALTQGAHVLVEKPMALSVDDAMQMIETAKTVHKIGRAHV